MKDTSMVRSVNKGTSIVTEAAQSELVEQNKTIEEKRLKIALDLRRF